MPERVLVFGTFDGLHDGHLFFLQSAKRFGKRLIVVVALDEHVRQFKHKKPKFSQQERLDAVNNRLEVDEAVFSDRELGSFHVLELLHPDLVILGYDQKELETALTQWMEKTNITIPMIKMLKK